VQHLKPPISTKHLLIFKPHPSYLPPPASSPRQLILSASLIQDESLKHNHRILLPYNCLHLRASRPRSNRRLLQLLSESRLFIRGTVHGTKSSTRMRRLPYFISILICPQPLAIPFPHLPNQHLHRQPSTTQLTAPVDM
jgi:hypothetical protein